MKLKARPPVIAPCYICEKPGVRKEIVEKDDRVHTYFFHKQEKGPGRPSKCDAGVRATEEEFNSSETPEYMKKNNTKFKEKLGARVQSASKQIIIKTKAWLHICQRCEGEWTSEKHWPKQCNYCKSPNWDRK